MGGLSLCCVFGFWINNVQATNAVWFCDEADDSSLNPGVPELASDATTSNTSDACSALPLSMLWNTNHDNLLLSTHCLDILTAATVLKLVR